MRRALIVFVILIVLGIGGVSFAHAALTAAQDDVSFTETASYGDVSAADGLTVSVRAQLKQHLLWNTTHTFGSDGKTETDFVFSSKIFEWHLNYLREILSMNITTDYSATTSGGNLLSDNNEYSVPDNGFTSVRKILLDIASRTQNGERHSEIVNFKDYYDYYDISAAMLPDEQYHFYYYTKNDGWSRYITPYADETKIKEAFNNYFKIPVPYNHRIEVEICKDIAGNVVGLSTMTLENSAWMQAYSVNTENGIYFALQTMGITDFSGVNGGFGIYLLPASTIVDDEGTQMPTLDFNNISTEHSLDESISVLGLDLSEDNSSLNLLTLEEGRLYLTVIELATMSQKQKLPLFDNVSEPWLHTVKYTDGLLYILLGDERFVLAELNEEGIYQIALSYKRDIGLLNEELVAKGYYGSYEPFISWDGERLAIVSANQRFVPYDGSYSSGYSYALCGFVLEIIDESGLRYKGLYESSLDMPPSRGGYGSDNMCFPVDPGGLSVYW